MENTTMLELRPVFDDETGKSSYLSIYNKDTKQGIIFGYEDGETGEFYVNNHGLMPNSYLRRNELQFLSENGLTLGMHENMEAAFNIASEAFKSVYDLSQKLNDAYYGGNTEFCKDYL